MIARTLARDGYCVCLLARDGPMLVTVVDEVRSVGGLAMSRTLDVTDEVAVGDAVGAVLASWGRIDLLVNCAGSIELEVPLWEAEVDQWWSVITTNVRGPFLMTRAVVPAMIAAGGGRVINLNSGASTAERADLSAYSASKSALARITGSTIKGPDVASIFAIARPPTDRISSATRASTDPTRPVRTGTRLTVAGQSTGDHRADDPGGAGSSGNAWAALAQAPR